MKQNFSYTPPTSKVMEVKFEGVICQSGGINNPDDYTPGPDPFAASALLEGPSISL